MHTLNDKPNKKAVVLKPDFRRISKAFQEPLPVQTPDGDLVEPTLRLGNKEFYEVDLAKASDRQVLELHALYTSDRLPKRLIKQFITTNTPLIPATWVLGGVA